MGNKADVFFRLGEIQDGELNVSLLLEYLCSTSEALSVIQDFRGLGSCGFLVFFCLFVFFFSLIYSTWIRDPLYQPL